MRGFPQRSFETGTLSANKIAALKHGLLDGEKKKVSLLAFNVRLLLSERGAEARDYASIEH